MNPKVNCAFTSVNFIFYAIQDLLFQEGIKEYILPKWLMKNNFIDL